MDFLSGIWNWITGNNVASALAKTALLGFASRLINDNVNESQIKNSNTQKEVVDKGVRLQLDADTQNKIPVQYGEAFFGGYLTDARISNDYKKMKYCLTLAEVPGTKYSTGQLTAYNFISVYLNNNKVFFKSDGVTVNYTVDSAGNQDSSMSGLIKIYLYGGTTGIHPDGYAGTTPAPNTIITEWGNNFPMTGLLYAIVEVTYNKAKNVTGLPDCLFHVKNNMILPGDVLVDYMTSTRYGAGISGSEINATAMTALNTYANTGFSYQTSAGQTETGIISINGLIDTNTTVLTNMEEIAKAANSWISYNIHEGLWTVVINQPGTAVATLDDSNIVGEISISGTSLTQLNNSVDVKYQNRDIKDKTDYVKITIPSGDLYQNEPGSTLQLSLPFTNSQAVALRIGIQSLKQNRIDKVITFTADYSFINITAGDIINVTSDIYGFSSKPFRVITTEEVEGEQGNIEVKFTCLEYSASVYTGDISEYAIETDDGLFAIGAIGKPPIPTVTKTEKANVPRINVTGKAPTGVVESLEYWISFDVDVVNDDDRIYEQFSTFRNKDGALLTYNQNCVIRYSQLNAGQFYIKVRGANSIISGPFSDPSAKITYNPVVVADTVSNTPTTDPNGSLMSFGLLALMSLLNDLMNGVTGAGSLFDAISDLFNGETPGGGGTTPTSNCCTCFLSWSPVYPFDRSTYECPESDSNGDLTDWTGDYRFSISSTYLDDTFILGAGFIKLYKSDGTLVQSVNATNLVLEGSQVKVTFNEREPGVDYYIIFDEGIIKTKEVKGRDQCILPACDDPQTWNFHTAPTEETIVPYNPENPNADEGTPATPTGCGPIKFVRLELQNYTCGSNVTSNADPETNIGIVFNQPITLSNGTVQLYENGSVIQTFTFTQTYKANKISDELFWTDTDKSGAYKGPNTIRLNPTRDFAKGASIYAVVSAGAIESLCLEPNEEITTSTATIDNGPTPTVITPGSGKSFNSNQVQLNYDRTVIPSTANVNVYDQNNNLIKSVPVIDGALSKKEG